MHMAAVMLGRDALGRLSDCPRAPPRQSPSSPPGPRSASSSGLDHAHVRTRRRVRTGECANRRVREQASARTGECANRRVREQASARTGECANRRVRKQASARYRRVRKQASARTGECANRRVREHPGRARVDDVPVGDFSQFLIATRTCRPADEMSLDGECWAMLRKAGGRRKLP